MFKGTLYPFQEEATEQMVDRGQMLLALVMGAGKTVTTIAALEKLFASNEIKKVIVVVPSALKYQWSREIKKFTDSTVSVIDGSAVNRKKLWRESLSVKYVVVNPESLVNDMAHFEKHKFDAIVVDEATMIKTPRAKRSRLIKRIGKKYHYRFALTGQPIENRPEELFSIMEFVDPAVLGKFEVFDRTFIVRDHFGKPNRYRNLKALHESMKEVMVRKTREDIQDQLPQVINHFIPVPFDSAGASIYKKLASDLLASIQKAITQHGRGFDLWSHYYGNNSNMEAQGEIMSKLTTLRMFCDNPELVKISAEMYLDDNNDQGSKHASQIVAQGVIPDNFNTPKLDAVLQYIEDVLNEDPKNKVVLFSFFKNNLRLIQNATKHLTTSVLFMGGMDMMSRDKAKQQFATDPNTRLFLSSDAGGYGVDLPVANYLISYDLPWSAGKLDQREARIIRLSSEFPHVNIVSFVMKGSIEERQYEMLQEKRNINKAFIDGGHDHKGNFQLNLGALSSFLTNSEV
jgi:SNF2 family DNA or RNA helicase